MIVHRTARQFSPASFVSFLLSFLSSRLLGANFKTILISQLVIRGRRNEGAINRGCLLLLDIKAYALWNLFLLIFLFLFLIFSDLKNSFRRFLREESALFVGNNSTFSRRACLDRHLPIREESSLERSSVFWDSAGDVASRSRNFPWIERCHGGFRGFWKNFSNVRAVWKLGILSIIGSVPILCKLSLALCLRSSFIINATTPGTGCRV